MKESVVDISGHKYRYTYDSETKATKYLGPVGDGPALSEEEFMKAISEEINLGDITVPERWGMSTDEGNEELQQNAENLLDTVKKANHQWVIKKLDIINYRKQIIAALDTYVQNWVEMDYSEDFSEASDTAVREHVWEFYEQVAYASYLGRNISGTRVVAHKDSVFEIPELFNLMWQEHDIKMEHSSKP